MTPSRDPPTPPSSPPRRISLLPPELDDIDAAWGDEPPTVVPSRAPSLPPREPLISLIDDDPDNRVTSIPELPQDEFARRLMAETKSEPPLLDAPPPNADDELLFVLDRDDPFDRPTRDGVKASAYPTAPPPAASEDENERLRTVPRVPQPQTGAPPRRAVPQTPPPVTPITLAPATHREPLSRDDRATRPERPLELGPQPRAPVVLEAEAPLSAVERARRAVTPQLRPEALVPHEPAAPDPAAEMRDRFAMGDFSGALDVAELILARAPADREASTMAHKCREVLYDMYSSRIAGFERELQVIMGPDQLRWLSLDHRAGFLLAMIDRGTTVDELLDVSGMARLDALRILCELLDQKVVALGR